MITKAWISEQPVHAAIHGAFRFSVAFLSNGVEGGHGTGAGGAAFAKTFVFAARFVITIFSSVRCAVYFQSPAGTCDDLRRLPGEVMFTQRFGDG